MYSITLSNGTQLSNLELNGNNYIAPEVIEDSVFEGNLDTVTISDGETSETHTDMVLLSNRAVNGQSWFILAEKSPQQKKEEAALAKMQEMEKAMYVLLTGEEI